MGVFYEDNTSKKRWVLKFDDPKALATIDAVFVTVEPNGGSHHPSGKQLLFAYLRVSSESSVVRIKPNEIHVLVYRTEVSLAQKCRVVRIDLVARQRSSLRRFLASADSSLFLILGLALATICLAQSPTGTISGIVFDPSGGIVAGAEILIVSDTTSVQYPAKTDSEGIYLVANLPPGPYRIQVSKIGFKTIIKPDIVIHVQDALAINFRLPLGAVSEIVTVQGGAPLVNTESGSVSTVDRPASLSRTCR